MTRWEYTHLWWEGSTTSTANGQLGHTAPPIGEEVMDKLNALGAEGWAIDQITAAPLTTGWISPRRGNGRCRLHRQGPLLSNASPDR